ncbi:MAG: hypothetical protein HQL76_04160 [Magnetococcales bacterium]|nr:hypothetical protein [Magnetococcales bacterium]
MSCSRYRLLPLICSLLPWLMLIPWWTARGGPVEPPCTGAANGLPSCLSLDQTLDLALPADDARQSTRLSGLVNAGKATTREPPPHAFDHESMSDGGDPSPQNANITIGNVSFPWLPAIIHGYVVEHDRRHGLSSPPDRGTVRVGEAW